MNDRRDLQPGPPTFMPVGSPLRPIGEVIQVPAKAQLAALAADVARLRAERDVLRAALERELSGARRSAIACEKQGKVDWQRHFARMTGRITAALANAAEGTKHGD